MNRTLRGAASAGLALFTLLAGAGAPAHAGTYDVASCRTPWGAPAGIGDAFGGWQHQSGPRADSALSWSNGCADGNGLTVAVGGAAPWPEPYIYSEMLFRPPSDTRISGFSLEWDGYAIPSDASKAGFVDVGTDRDRYVQMVGAGSISGRFTRVSNIDAGWVYLHAGCQGGAVRCGGGTDAWARLISSQITLTDDTSPSGSVYGAAAEATTWTGAQTLTVDAEDRGAGVHTAVVQVDGQARPAVRPDDNGGRCIQLGTSDGRRVFGSPRPCKADPLAVAVAVPAQSYADGPHEVSVIAEDAAGNTRTLWSAMRTFDSHPPVLDGEAQVAGAAREGEPLTCTIGGIDGQSPTVGYAWVRANADGSGRETIADATGDTYVLGADDVGRKVLCRITARDAGGTATSESALTSGPFADGRTVLGICEGLPTGPKDPCGDLDGDGRRNRDDDDADGDGVSRGHDPDDHNAQATGRDVATPSSVSTTTTTNTHTATETIRETQTIPDGPAGAINGSFGGPGASLTVHHEGSSSRTIRVPHGRRVVIEGRLRAPDGRGVEGAKLEVSTQDRAAGSAFVPFGALLTEAEGAYKLILPAGPSRTVRVGYRARFGDSSFAQTSDVAVLVRAGLQFRLNRRTLRNGRSVRYIGRLLGPRTGHRFVEVQVRVGRRWIVVCSVRTDAKGSYGCAHRFTKTFRRTRYVFRARVRRQATLPYEPAVSRTRSLTVRP